MQKLQEVLDRIDGRGYKAYKDLQGGYSFGDCRLIVDYVQGDPYAPPSRVRAVVPWETAGLPENALQGDARRVAARDFLARAFSRAVQDEKDIRIDAGKQTVLDRTACLFTPDGVELRFTVTLPARGRTILGRQAARLLLESVPEAVRAVTSKRLDLKALKHHCDVTQDQQSLRAQLDELNLAAFLADGSILPRRSGVDDRPLQDAVKLSSPSSLRVTLDTPNAGPLSGLGIPLGVSLIVGGGFHGKSTLLKSVEAGVYDHIPGDGRERGVSNALALKIRAEDGRVVHSTDLSPFISNLPYGKSTRDFSTDLASGSTSQAASMQEALEMGAGVLLVDEDTSATNFMIRDQRMQKLVAAADEPITPFVDRIRELSHGLGVSTLLVMGGSGDYFDHADTVIQMHEYQPRDVTGAAREIAATYTTGRVKEPESSLKAPLARVLDAARLDPCSKPGKRRIKVDGLDVLLFGRDEVDLRALEQLADPSQVKTIGLILARLAENGKVIHDPAARIRRMLENDLPRLAFAPEGDLARPRPLEAMAVLNRLRSARLKSSRG
ncbi:ABC-ATPase domain-containing protein [Desulfonatronospira sp.]|uniref:ABC-ATPase domain-containing protein n=1 Tax=Desulfonatronospira sp. TaxID=1962951 RepID=UPI0025C11155|nr:ABC-ATPase domain-containing protein [Desulfonatronospira sp.]